MVGGLLLPVDLLHDFLVEFSVVDQTLNNIGYRAVEVLLCNEVGGADLASNNCVEMCGLD